jgi:hypothetical protein
MLRNGYVEQSTTSHIYVIIFYLMTKTKEKRLGSSFWFYMQTLQNLPPFI